ncbi:MAG: CHAP domain-containing protein [Clostridia bacterium]|nr:CHAP domain-containing protein [Clostridia bacterium]
MKDNPLKTNGNMKYSVGGKTYDASALSSLSPKTAAKPTQTSVTSFSSYATEKNQTSDAEEQRKRTPRPVTESVKTVETSAKIQNNLNYIIGGSTYKPAQSILKTSENPLSPKTGTSTYSSISKTGNIVAHKAQTAISGQSDDIGTTAAAGVVSAGILAAHGFRAAQTASDLAVLAVKTAPQNIERVVKVAQNTYDVTLTTAKAVVTLSNTARLASGAMSPMTSQSVRKLLMEQASKSGLAATRTSQRIASTVDIYARRLQTAFVKGQYAVTRVRMAKRSLKSIQTGQTKLSDVVKAKTREATIAAWRRTRTAARTSAKLGVKTASATVKKGMPFAYRKASGLAIGIGGVLASADNEALSTTGNVITGSTYGVKTAVKGTKNIAKATVKTAKKTVRATKATYNGLNYVRQKGLRAAWARARNKTRNAVARAGKSVVNAILSAFKMAGRKVVLPLILIISIVAASSSILTAPAAVAGGLLSGLFDVSMDGQIMTRDIREFISDPTYGIPAYRAAKLEDVITICRDTQEVNGGAYDIVRFRTTTSEGYMTPDAATITAEFYTNEELINMVQPMFNAIIIKDYLMYGQVPYESDAYMILENIMTTLLQYTDVFKVEYCGQDIYDGSGEPNWCEACGVYHASYSSCVNFPLEKHYHENLTYKKCSCDYSVWEVVGYYPSGAAIYATRYYCNGYYVCEGHQVYECWLTLEGQNELEMKYLQQPMDELLEKTARTEDEEYQLRNLMDVYALYRELARMVQIQYGGGMTEQDLSGVVWVDGGRTPNQAIIDLALTQVGMTGGQPYLRSSGMGETWCPWCACFVWWCMKESGQESNYAYTENNRYCPNLTAWFSENGRWGERSYGREGVVTGDVIFFDYDRDGTPDHVGLVIGRDADNVYTVEGNRQNSVIIYKYPLDSMSIYGYGLMNY